MIYDLTYITKDPLIPRRNMVNWHYVRDDQMFLMIKLVSRHQNTQQFDAMLPVELTNEDIRNSAAYKEYYAITSGAAPPKIKVSVRKTHSSFDTTITPPKATGTRLSTSSKGKQPAKSSKAKGVPDVPTYESDEEISWKLSDEDDDNDDDQEDDTTMKNLYIPSCLLMMKKLKTRKVLILLFKYHLKWKNLMMTAMMMKVMA
nr:hypothetical protein [Tanacetum cinerariifolium]